jgi:hypothetical protein
MTDYKNIIGKREIEFRVWDGHTKSFFSSPDTHYLPKVDCKHGLLTFKFEDDKYTIMQYTGLKDKNGTKIFEGDIVEENGLKRVVQYGYCEYDLEGATGDVCYGFNLDHSVDRYVKVIGNIFENPELLPPK